MTTYGVDLGAGIPSGAIVIWSGTLSNIPSGFLLCDGTSGTPDLRDKFVKCVPNAVTNPGLTGGESEHTLATTEMPNHNHSVFDAGHQHQSFFHGSITGIFVQPPRFFANRSKTLNTDTKVPIITVNNAGTDTPHENKPAFFEVLYIQKS